MGVLLRLSDAQLGQPQMAEVLAQAVFHLDAGEGHLHVGHRGVVLRVAHVGQGEELAGEAVKVRVHKGPGDLPGPVGPEVEEDHAVVVGHAPIRVHHHRLHELIGDAPGIGLPHGGHRVGVGVGAFAVDHGVVGGLQPVPALVTVHGVVAADHRGDLAHADGAALLHGLGHEVRAGGGRDVPAVQEGVEIDPLQTLFLGQAQQGPQVLDVGVDTAVGQQTDEVQGRSLFQTAVHGVEVGAVAEEGAVLNGTGDPGQVLKHHPAGADVGVAHLAVAHLPLGQTHIQTGGGQSGVGIFGKELVQTGSLCRCNGVA